MSKSVVLKLFKFANINLYSDIIVNDSSFYADLLQYKTLGFGESYMSGKIDTSDLYNLTFKLQKLNTMKFTDYIRILNLVDYIYLIFYGFWKLYTIIIYKLINYNNILLSKKVAKIHYDLPNILYTQMLDSTMLYSCGYFENTNDLHLAQLQKTDLIIQKLHLSTNDTVLEIGCGWGFIAYTIANKYPKCNVIGISISESQIAYCNNKYNLPNLKFELKDYREIPKHSFNKIYSVGMFEHVGSKNYNDFFNITYDLLKNDGIMLLHTICKSCQSSGNDPWLEKYIFPGGYLPSISEITKDIENTKFDLSDIQEFGLYYSKTLDSWLHNFQKSYPELQKYDSTIFDSKFKRMWEFYLIMCKVAFDSKYCKLSQLVFTKNRDTVYHR
jgi:cyclopropane-fatty-acyl-phospholipid synthase